MAAQDRLSYSAISDELQEAWQLIEEKFELHQG